MVLAVAAQLVHKRKGDIHGRLSDLRPAAQRVSSAVLANVEELFSSAAELSATHSGSNSDFHHRVRSPTASEHGRAYLEQIPDPSVLPAVGLRGYCASDDNYGSYDTYSNYASYNSEDSDSDHGVSLNAGQSAPTASGPVARAEHTIDGNGQDGIEVERCEALMRLSVWPGFIRAGQMSIILHDWKTHQGHLYLRPVGEQKPHSLLSEKVLVGNEIGVNGRWQQHLGQVMWKAFGERRLQATMGDFDIVVQSY
ncbi:hypothetical protein ATEIFO6365_0001093400 [Aspergillus terreus]|uniref:Uncharacterized protein n=1 Tax=Aspergillus terreus TaxID=33178 RepID=A0A5M3YMW6_ASPTE|nr:hypothetical protein ATETN484_0001085500 [Aspergillus terreus]GFF12710.1 hypothetical protein ATEIFO6365_0001093400 [Aspergillus terreus]